MVNFRSCCIFVKTLAGLPVSSKKGCKQQYFVVVSKQVDKTLEQTETIFPNI